MPETVMCFLCYEFKPGFLVDVTRFQEDTVGPEHQFLVTTASSEANTLFDKASTQPKTACLWFNQQQPELGDCFTALHDKYRTNDLSVHLCNPAAFSFRVVVVDEIRDDLSDQRLKMLVPAILLSIQDTMPVGDPSHITRLMSAEKKGFGILEPFRENALYGLHGLQKALLLLFAHVVE